MPFTPATVTLHEAGPDAPSEWTMTEPLAWNGTFRGRACTVEVPTSPRPFTTDLASVPRSLTWLFPRYGRYTKAAVLHDHLCRRFPTAGRDDGDARVRDRSDADELFRAVMAELGVPWLRRWLMWAAVSWATRFTGLVPGRRSRPALRWTARVVAVVAVVAAVALLVVRPDRAAVVACLLGLPAALLVAGTLGLGRADRAVDGLVVYALTVVFSPLLALGAGLAVILFAYLALEDVVRGLPAARGFVRDLRSEDAKMEKLATPQFARLAAVVET